MKLYTSIIASFSLLFCMQQGLVAGDYEDKAIDAEMYNAIAKSDIKKVSELLDKGANPDSRSLWGSTNLGFAVMTKKMEIVELLLSKGANPNLRGDLGSDLPLIYAINNGNVAMIELLLKYKANPSFKTESWNPSPIEFAQMTLGYPSLNGKCHPIVALLFKNIKDKNIEE